jgi:hypothetical protein
MNHLQKLQSGSPPWSRRGLGSFANCGYLPLTNDAFYGGYAVQRFGDLLIVVGNLEKQPPADSVNRNRSDVSGSAGAVSIHKGSDSRHS